MTSDSVHRPFRGHGAHAAPPWLALIGFILLGQAAGAIGGLATDPGLYQRLDTPAWSPPGWLFGPVWITLYAVMGIAAWLVWRRGAGPDRQRAMMWFGVQLALNAVWTPVFFGLEQLTAGLAIIALLLVAIVATIVAFARVSRRAAALLIPYLLWVGFATCLNLAIVWLN